MKTGIGPSLDRTVQMWNGNTFPFHLPPLFPPIFSSLLFHPRRQRIIRERKAKKNKSFQVSKVRTFERYIPSPEEIKALPDNMDEIFDKHGDDIILEDDEDGKNQHIYFLFGQHEGKKHYKCIKKDCPSSLLVEEIMEPSPPPSPSPPPTPKEDEQDKEHSKKKKRKSKKKSKKTAKEGNPQEGNLPQEEENEDWNK